MRVQFSLYALSQIYARSFRFIRAGTIIYALRSFYALSSQYIRVHHGLSALKAALAEDRGQSLRKMELILEAIVEFSLTKRIHYYKTRN